MQTKQLTTGAAVAAGLLFLVIAVLYLLDPASALPGFLPGHVAAGTAEAGHHHTTHGILAFALGLCCFVAARFLWGSTPDTA